MADVSTWSTTAGSNNSSSPDGFPENMAPSGVNDSAREVMAAIATWYADHAWVLRGRKSANQSGTQHTVAFASSTTFTTAAGDGDTRSIYHAGRRIKCEVTAGTVVGRITNSTGTGPVTVTVSLDSGSLDSGLDQVYLGPEITNIPIDASGVARSAWNLLTTRGDVLYRDGTSAARLALGTDGQVLQSDGTDVAWANPDGWKFVAQYTPSATASQAITDLDQSSDHLFVMRQILPATDGAGLIFRVSPDSGGSPTFDNGASDYLWEFSGIRVGVGAVDSADSGDTGIDMTGNVGNVAAIEDGIDGEILTLNVGASQYPVATFETRYRNSSSQWERNSGSGQRVTAQVTQAVQFIMTTGNITSGTIDHYTRPVQ